MRVKMKKLKPKPKVPEESCALCGSCDDDPVILGDKVKVPELKRSVHYFCLLTSCGVYQKGAEREGVFGFLVNDIKREMRRSSRLTCFGCHKKGACVGCFVPRCRKKVHFPCGQRLEFVSQFKCPFPSYCPAHAPSQSLSPGLSPGLDLSLPQSCSVCLDPIDPLLSFSVLKCPSCHSSWFHRHCVQRQAHSSGLFFFRCTLCNNKDQFQEEMLRLGIHIPERDASWELETGAYSELLEVYRHCDAETCECPEGRGHSAKTGYLEIIRCRLCGSRGTHRKCSGLRLETRDWACPDCTSAIDGKCSPCLIVSLSLCLSAPLRSRLSSSPSSASPQELFRSLRPRPRPQHQVTFRLRPRSGRHRPLTDRQHPLLEVSGEDVLAPSLELLRSSEFDPNRELSISSPGTDGALQHFLNLLLRQIQDCEVFEGPMGCKNLALNAQALKEDLYFDIGVLLALALVHGAPCLRFFSPALYQLLFNFPQNQPLTLSHLTPGSPLTSTIQRIEAAQSISELQSVLSSCSDHLTLSGCNRPIKSLEERAGLVDDLIAFSLITRMQLPLQRFREGLQTLGVFEQVQLYQSVFLPLFTGGGELSHTSPAQDQAPECGHQEQDHTPKRPVPSIGRRHQSTRGTLGLNQD
ncbi:hypothetical protein NQD34_016613 [Periophthalmus magnuspinnatus]|nr:hypothetical protein NQD34_016613 [Periophthalmus magnuspinnatus]